MKKLLRLVLFLLIVLVNSFCFAQELSNRMCNEYSRRNDAMSEPNEYRKYMDKFITARTRNKFNEYDAALISEYRKNMNKFKTAQSRNMFKEYDAVLISENFALTSLPSFNDLQFTDVVVNNYRSISVMEQHQRDSIYLMKLQFRVESYNKIVCLWSNGAELPSGFDLFTVTHQSGVRVPFLRTYFPYENSCPSLRPYSIADQYNFCLQYENGRATETVFTTPSASSLLFLKSINNNQGLNKNHYIVGVIKQTNVIKQTTAITFGKKFWPNLQWIEEVVWGGLAPPEESLCDQDCGKVVVVDPINFLSLADSSPTYPGEFPWHVALFIHEGRNVRYECGGTLLNRVTILTAAHCVTNDIGQTLNPSQFTIRLGLYKLDGTELNQIAVSPVEFIPHESYNTTSMESDIAIVKLKNSVTYTNYIRPICIIEATHQFTVNNNVVPGWGRNESNLVQNDLRKISLTIPKRSDCRHNGTSQIRALLDETNYCAGQRNGMNVCRGDSGSGMITKINNQWYLRGIVSYGSLTENKICNPYEFSLFTNVTKFNDWIRLHNMQ